ncbi:MAG: hypothetical protein ACYC5Q_14385 [Thermoleophilia bacterium]
MRRTMGVVGPVAAGLVLLLWVGTVGAVPGIPATASPWEDRVCLECHQWNAGASGVGVTY